MKRLVLLPLLFMLSQVAALAQTTLHGTVYDAQSKTSVPFANVVLFKASDSTKMFMGTMTDKQGSYSFDHLPVGSYKISVSYVGYKTLQQLIQINQGNAKQSIRKDFVLSEDVEALGDVVVTSSRMRQKTDHQIISFDKEQIKSARYAKDLLLNVPNLREDPMTGLIATLNGGGILILINGVKASDAQLKMIPPEKVLRVEYYDIPPARYAYIGTVVNVITKKLDNGYSFGAQTVGAFTTGFNNSNAYFSMTHGNHRFDVEYDLSYRSYKHRITDTDIAYILNGIQRRDQTVGSDAFGYTVNTASLKYAYVQPEKQLFQVTFSPEFITNFSNAHYEGTYTKATTSEIFRKEMKDKTGILHPSLDLYYWKKLSSKDELSLNLNLNHFQTKANNDHKEWEKANNRQTYDDVMTLNNQKQSAIAEAAYSRSLWQATKLNTGYQLEYSHLFSNINNLFGKSKYTSDYLKQYAYGEMSGMHNKWMYRLSLGLTHIYSNSSQKSYNQLLFTPKVVLGYSFSDNHSLRLIGERAPSMPSISALSNNAVSVTRDIVQMGNPKLISSSYSYLQLVDSYNNKWISLQLGGAYQYERNPISQYYLIEKERVVLSYRNTPHNHLYITYLSSQIKPFGGNILQLGVFLQPTWLKQAVPEGTLSSFWVENNFNLTMRYKKFLLNCQYRIPFYSTGGYMRSLSENTSSISLSYNWKNWQFGAGMYFVGQDAHYHSETIAECPVRYNRDTRIKDNNSMIIFRLSYDFQSGKEKKVTRKLNNQDNAAPTF